MYLSYDRVAVASLKDRSISQCERGQSFRRATFGMTSSYKLLPRSSARYVHTDGSDSTVENHNAAAPHAGDDGTIKEVETRERHKYRSFFGLGVTTACSVLLLVADAQKVAYSGTFYTTITQNRASVQIIVQVIAATFGLIQVSVLYRIFNYATRVRLARHAVQLEVLSLWSSISLGSIRWSLSLSYLVPLLLFMLICAVPGALWAGAISPVSTTITNSTTLNLPQYTNMSNIREWPSEIDSSGPALRNQKGFFTYSPGVLFQGLLTQALSTATTVDGSDRQHAKYDNSNFLYVRRSFGIGASVGLTDDHILVHPLAMSYNYQENGYASQTNCIYNSSAEFFLEEDGDETMLYAAQGYLPDSVGPEYSVYVGHGPDAIVSIGVGSPNGGSSEKPRYLGIAAGSDYSNLDKTQCETHFKPTLFNVTVDIVNKKISVLEAGQTAEDIEPSGNLTHALQRQFELYSNDLTNIYQSVLGNSINFSIADYRTFLSSSKHQDAPKTDAEISLTGLTNSITAMTDDLLVTYASAQLMIAEDTRAVLANVLVHAVRFGEPIYIISTFVINFLIVVVVIGEAIRSRGWKSLTKFDYSDPADVAIAGLHGGLELARVTQQPSLNAQTLVTVRQSTLGHALITI